MRVIVYRTFSDELRDLWKGLEQSSQHYVFQCYEWLSYWQRTIGDGTLNIQPHIAVVLDAANQARIIFPLGVRRRLGARVLEFLGGGQNDYHGPLIHDVWIHDAGLMRRAWVAVEKILPGHDVRHFSKLPSQWGQFENPMLQVWKHVFQDNSYSCSLPETFPEYQGRLRSKLRADTKRQRRRLSETGSVDFEVVEHHATYVQVMNALIEQKRGRYISTGVPDSLADESTQQFYKGLALESYTVACHLSALRHNGQPIATHWGAIYRDRFYFLMPTFATGEVSRYSPGRLLLENLLEWSIQHSVKRFDFTVGGEDYKKDWCDLVMPLFEHMRLATPLGAFYFLYIRVLRKARGNTVVWTNVKRVYGFARNWKNAQ